MVFALIGQTGIGKSTIINALLSSSAGGSIAQTDPGSKACTSTAVYYKYITATDNKGSAYKTCINFLLGDELRGMLELLKEEYLAVHSPGEPIDDDPADQEIDATMAAHAENVFKMIWEGQDTRLVFMRCCHDWVTKQLSDCDDVDEDFEKIYDDYREHLERAARAHYALESARNLQEKATSSLYYTTRDVAPLSLTIIAASPKAYNNWLKSRRSKKDSPDVDVFQTHIPDLINLLLLKAAQANHRVIGQHLKCSALMHDRIETLVEGYKVRERREIVKEGKLKDFVTFCYGVPGQLKDFVKDGYMSEESIYPRLEEREINWNSTFAEVFEKDWSLWEDKMKEIMPSGVRDWAEEQLDHLAQAIPELPDQDARHDADAHWDATKAQVLELVDEFVDSVVQRQNRILNSYTQASGHNNMMAKILDPVYSRMVAESTGTGALLRQKLALKSELTKVGSDERPWLGVAQGVLELTEELHNDIKNKLTDHGNMLKNMGGPASTDPALRKAVDQLLALLPKLRQDQADLKNQYLGEADDPESMDID
ncbi:hypothetical protein HBI60_149890 [Parastagonospora nodorum]|nr:hypothetical protein HBI12_235200 [Parastagonospora nodorum]KAH6380674.1 hypothetical protein HBI14_240890 [Parastagonospora nodorum]KAH6392930.1 hypothetical protein HBI60_149890 [Parastagonospora nodorum]